MRWPKRVGLWLQTCRAPDGGYMLRYATCDLSEVEAFGARVYVLEVAPTAKPKRKKRSKKR